MRHSQRYKDVLKSERWCRLRECMIANFQVCERCQAGGRLELHHDDYTKLGCETWEDVELLCPNCHVKADQEREAETEWRRIQGWADKVYGAGIEVTDDIEAEFYEWLGDRQ